MDDHPHLLIVEDECSIIEVLVAALETSYRISSACNVADSIAILRTSHIHVALIDHVLPDGRGSEVANVADELGVVVIEMSGHPKFRWDLEQSRHLQLFKPFRLNELLSTLELALRAGARHPEPAEEVAAGAGG